MAFSQNRLLKKRSLNYTNSVNSGCIFSFSSVAILLSRRRPFQENGFFFHLFFLLLYTASATTTRQLRHHKINGTRNSSNITNTYIGTELFLVIQAPLSGPPPLILPVAAT